MRYQTLILVKRLQRYQRSKLEDEKNICQRGRPQAHGFEPGHSADIFFVLQLWPLISLQPLDQNQCLVPHLKDLLRICLENKAQGFWTSFKVCNLGSKYPCFIRAYVVRVLLFSFLAVSKFNSVFHHLPSVGLKQLCAFAHLGCTWEAGTS